MHSILGSRVSCKAQMIIWLSKHPTGYLEKHLTPLSEFPSIYSAVVVRWLYFLLKKTMADAYTKCTGESTEMRSQHLPFCQAFNLPNAALFSSFIIAVETVCSTVIKLFPPMFMCIFFKKHALLVP